MSDNTVKNAPPLYGWTIALGTGAVATGVSLGPIDLGWMGALFIGSLVILLVGTIFTIAENGGPRAGPSEGAAPMAGQSDDGGAGVASADRQAGGAGTPPVKLDAPRGGQADDLQKMTGIGPVLEQKLNEIGIWHYNQIAEWTAAEVAWVDDALNFKGRIERDDWIAQARALANEDQVAT